MGEERVEKSVGRLGEIGEEDGVELLGEIGSGFVTGLRDGRADALECC
jgi:hypothetical protein